MRKQEVLQKMQAIGIVPVLRAETEELAIEVADALIEGGIPVLEITLTVPNALRVFEKLNKKYGDEVLLGAGTVLDAETARIFILAGAKFVVSPCLNVSVIELCRRYGTAVFPGALTPTEIVAAWQAGADAVKVFPASAMGGANYLKSLKAPLPQIDLIPTGGVSLSTAEDFIKAGAWALGVGADLADTKAVAAGDRQKVVQTAKDYRNIWQKLNNQNQSSI